ncbi:MAG: hypothetical protein HQK65_17105 [Desulfamplus sp.]|nr:hypothetical protein [Desulfamplus sp.]
MLKSITPTKNLMMTHGWRKITMKKNKAYDLSSYFGGCDEMGDITGQAKAAMKKRMEQNSQNAEGSQ